MFAFIIPSKKLASSIYDNEEASRNAVWKSRGVWLFVIFVILARQDFDRIPICTILYIWNMHMIHINEVLEIHNPDNIQTFTKSRSLISWQVEFIHGGVIISDNSAFRLCNVEIYYTKFLFEDLYENQYTPV